MCNLSIQWSHEITFNVIKNNMSAQKIKTRCTSASLWTEKSIYMLTLSLPQVVVSSSTYSPHGPRVSSLSGSGSIIITSCITCSCWSASNPTNPTNLWIYKASIFIWWMILWHSRITWTEKRFKMYCIFVKKRFFLTSPTLKLIT